MADCVSTRFFSRCHCRLTKTFQVLHIYCLAVSRKRQSWVVRGHFYSDVSTKHQTKEQLLSHKEAQNVLRLKKHNQKKVMSRNSKLPQRSLGTGVSESLPNTGSMNSHSWCTSTPWGPPTNTTCSALLNSLMKHQRFLFNIKADRPFRFYKHNLFQIRYSGIYMLQQMHHRSTVLV